MTEPELVRVVRSDLEHLLNWADGVDENVMRRESPVLRHLLIDGNLQKARKLLGMKGEARVLALDLRSTLGDGDLSGVIVGIAAGCRTNGTTVSASVVSTRELGPPVAGALTPNELTITRYLSQPAIYVVGQMVSRRSILKYVANKLGGAHFDQGRDRKGDADARALDQARAAGIRVLDYEPPYVEIAAMGQALISSPSVMEPFGLKPAESVVENPAGQS
jgi:hypothetical protein